MVDISIGISIGPEMTKEDFIKLRNEMVESICNTSGSSNSFTEKYLEQLNKEALIKSKVSRKNEND